MENMILQCVFVFSLLVVVIYVLKFIETIWLKKIDAAERKGMAEVQAKEQWEILKRKLELLNKQEEIRKFERPHEIELKK
jgi:23S rRNA maturation mini-RNase III